MQQLHVNESQAEAIYGAVSQSNGFVLIQGPPGTGKTMTLLALITALKEDRVHPYYKTGHNDLVST